MGHLSANILHQAEARGAGTTSLPSDRDQEPFAQAGPAWTQRGMAGMPLRRLIFLATLVLAATMSPSAALAAAHGTDRPLTGTGTGTTTLNLLTGAAASDGTGHLSHLGAGNRPRQLDAHPRRVPARSATRAREPSWRRTATSALGYHRVGDDHGHHRPDQGDRFDHRW